MTNWFPSVLCHCWFGHLACNEMTCYVLIETLSLYTTTSIVTDDIKKAVQLNVSFVYSWWQLAWLVRHNV